MEVAHLDGNVRKHCSRTSPAIKNDDEEDKTLLFELSSRVPVHRRILSLNESPQESPLQSRRPEHEHAITTGEKGDIGNEDERLRIDAILFENNQSELLLNTREASLILLGKLYE